MMRLCVTNGRLVAPLLADSFQHEMKMRMGFAGMQGEGISVLAPELLDLGADSQSIGYLGAIACLSFAEFSAKRPLHPARRCDTLRAWLLTRNTARLLCVKGTKAGTHLPVLDRSTRNLLILVVRE
jgi:hypothetical protein